MTKVFNFEYKSKHKKGKLKVPFVVGDNSGCSYCNNNNCPIFKDEIGIDSDLLNICKSALEHFKGTSNDDITDIFVCPLIFHRDKQIYINRYTDD